MQICPYNLKLYPSPPDARDHIIKAAVPIRAKGFTDLSTYCTSVKDQGMLGSCTAFASIGAMEYLHKRFGGNKTDDMFSEKFTYYTTRVNILGWSPEDSGAYVRDAVKSLVKYGTCLEKTCTYDNDCKTAPSSTAYTEASKYQALSYAKFEDGKNPTERKTLIELIKANLDAGLPIIGGFICYSNIWTAQNGVIPKSNGQIIGGHAILIVGYDDTKQLFKFKNSWGSTWGDAGYGYLPYEYYFSGDMFDLWSIRKSELEDVKSVGLEIEDPKLKKEEVKNDIIGVFADLTGSLDALLDKRQCIKIINDLMIKYRSKPNLINLISRMKDGLYNLAS